MICLGTSVAPMEDIVGKEVDRYLTIPLSDEHITVLEWWEKYGCLFPHLSKLAMKYMAIPTSSVPSERVFSLTGHLVNKKQARLNPKHVQMITFLKT